MPLKNVLLEMSVSLFTDRAFLFFLLLMVWFLRAFPCRRVCFTGILRAFQPFPDRRKRFGSTRLDQGIVWIMTMGATVNDPLALPVTCPLTMSAERPVVVPLHVATGADFGCVVKINILTE
jgi:hypothetical protein